MSTRTHKKTAVVAVESNPTLDLTQSPYQLFRLAPHAPNDTEEILLLYQNEWYLLKEARNTSGNYPIRVRVKVLEENLSLFFLNRSVELFPVNDETRKYLSLWGVMV